PTAARKPSVLERLLPPPLAYFLTAGLLTEKHFGPIVGLQDIYGPDLAAGGVKPSVGAGFGGRPGRVGPGQISEGTPGLRRAEEQPLLYSCGRPSTPDLTPGIVEACRHWEKFAAGRGQQLRQWEKAGFWWACMAVWLEMDADLLGKAIAAWADRYEDALF